MWVPEPNDRQVSRDGWFSHVRTRDPEGGSGSTQGLVPLPINLVLGTPTV